MIAVEPSAGFVETHALHDAARRPGVEALFTR
jgi:hypothetical protein